MKNIVNFYVDKFRSDRRKTRRMAALLLTLALVVTAGVFWQLHDTGIALTNETYCGLEEHTHTEDCYELVLTCGQEESEGTEGHTHDESCYETEQVLICGQEESEGAEGHTHTEDCYESVLVCEQEEHTHTVDCMVDESADVETAADWEKTLPDLTGVWAEDVVAVAQSQLGYTESTANFTLDEDGETRRGYTRYGAWAGNEYGDWDAMFASFCLYYGGVSTADFPEATGAYAWAAKLEDAGLYADAADCDPAAGDLVFLDADGNGKIDRVGVITAAADGKLTVIEGDSNDAVEKNTYSVSASAVVGYGLLPEQETDAADAENTLLTTASAEETLTAEEVQALIDALPTADEVAAMTTAEQTEVYTQLQAAYEAYEVLTAEEQALMDASAMDALFEYFEGQVTVTAAAEIDILDYIETYSETHYGYPVIKDISVKDAEGNTVEDGQLIAGDAYNIDLYFYFEGGIEAGTYVYNFPEGVTLGEGRGYVTIVDSEGMERTLGTWSIDSATGKLTFELNNLYDLSRFTHIELSATVSAVFENGMEEVTIGDVTYTVIEPPEDTSASLHKRAVQINVDDDTISWVIEVDGGANVGLADQTITDTISSDNHEYLEGNIDSLTIEIQADDGEYHTLSIDYADYWYWSESGWELVLPAEFECMSCGDMIELPKEDSTGWVVYIKYTTSISSPVGDSYVTYGNTVTFYKLEEKGKISTGKGNIDKTGVYKAGDSWEDTTIDWTIDVFIPSGEAYNWHISDTEDVVIGSSSQQYYYNALGESGTTITAEIDGKVYTVPNIDDAAIDGSDLIAWELSDTSTSGGYDYGRTIIFYTWDNEDGTWSQWWNIDSGTYLTITYSSSVVYDTDGDGEIENTDENLIEEYNTQGASLRNSVELYCQETENDSAKKVSEATAKVPLPSFLDKEQTTAPTSDNEWVVTYTVTFNAAMVDLSDLGTVTIADTMSTSLIYDRGSTVITAKDADGNTHKVTDYTIAYSSGTDNNVAEIILNESALGPYQYTLVYNAKIDGSGTVTYNNGITVTVSGETFTDEVGAKTVNDVSATAQSYSVTLTKKDADTSDTLAGAVFNVYNAEADALLTIVTTGTDGKATVSTNTTQGIIFRAHTLYYLIETKAPDGYQLDNTTRYYFWFCNTSRTCSTCASMEDELEAAGVASAYMQHGTYDSQVEVENIEITVTNEQGKQLPETGGSGTWMYALAGLALCGGAALALCRRREAQ
ncbi:MAG: LPXTG cell wall anchor domain-containing protein [Clostridiales bacterium]|nr:LPXTG cell wall anchor domain-containing protein [Clostridiales bacterium]